MINKKLYIFRLISLSLILLLFLSSCSISKTVLGSNVNNNTISDYKTFYNSVKEAMFNYDTSFTVYIKDYDESTYSIDVVKKILKDNIELQDNLSKYNLKVSRSLFSSKLTFNFIYTLDKKTILARNNTIKSKIKEIVSKVTNKNMKDYEKEAALHDYIVNNTKYDERALTGNMPRESFTAYGVLINGTGVCQGYAEAMNKLLKCAGLNSIVITGEANNGSGWIGHAWNLVNLDGQYYHIDTTWDDPITKDGSNRIRYSYFNLTDAQISKNHRWDKSNYPSCDATVYAFNNLNLVEKDSDGNIITTTKNKDEFITAAKGAITAGKSKATFKILNFNDSSQNVSDWIKSAYKETSKYGSYTTFCYKDEIWTAEYITVQFNYY